MEHCRNPLAPDIIMRPALQKLLSRPSSLELLRSLVEKQEHSLPRSILGRYRSRSPHRSCPYSGLAITRTHIPLRDHEGQAHQATNIQNVFNESEREQNEPQYKVQRVKSRRNSVSSNGHKQNSFVDWSARNWTAQELDFESNLDDTNTDKLLNRPEFRNDSSLWACLLDHRKRTSGDSGVMMLLNSIVFRDVHIVTDGPFAENLWPIFIDVGLRNHEFLERVLAYADVIAENDGCRWSDLYVHIIQHFLTQGIRSETLKWHHRLIQQHRPGNMEFKNLCQEITRNEGDMEGLKQIYTLCRHRDVYTCIVPILCEHEDFRTAFKWHMYLFKSGDYPPSRTAVEPLIHFLAIYYTDEAKIVTRSLVDAGVPFAPTMTAKLEEHMKISREVMNLIHGETIQVQVKPYSDELGSRWFASTWVSLDIAIDAVHALGVQEIGPLSLQSLALREPCSKSVAKRIDQLQSFDISIGQSLFSRAVEHFARNGNDEFLRETLMSDHHPMSLEDTKLQDNLLAEYRRKNDWPRYNRILEIQSLKSAFPTIEKRNFALRGLAVEGHFSDIRKCLIRMRKDNIPVQLKTISCIMKTTLRPRRPGKGPMVVIGRGHDTEECLEFLLLILNSGSFIPVTVWHEIIRRLGKAGQWKKVEELCHYLAVRYTALGKSRVDNKRYRVPLCLPSSHRLHPLKQLFTPSLQRAIVEWGFICGLRHHQPQSVHNHIPLNSILRAKRPTRLLKETLPMTSGIKLLKKLHQFGVHISGESVRCAIMNRLVTYYGHGRSKKILNRHVQDNIRINIEEAAREIDEALGGKFLTADGVDVKELVKVTAETRLRRQERYEKQKRHIGYSQSGTEPRRMSYRFPI